MIGDLFAIVISCVFAYYLVSRLRQEILDHLLDHAQAIRSVLTEVEPTQFPLQPVTLGHTIIVGQTGSGKSNYAMLQIIQRYNAQHRIYIVDTKNELTPIFDGICERCEGSDQADSIMTELLNMAQARSDLFAKTCKETGKPCRDLQEYQRLTKHDLPIVTLVLEELIVLMNTISQDKLIKLLVMGRSAGIFVLALSQYLKADILDRKGSVNFNTLLLLGKWDRISAGILFGSIEPMDAKKYQAHLTGPGTAVISESGSIRTDSVPRVSDKELERFIKQS